MGQIRWTRLIGVSVVAYLVAVGSLTVLFGNPFIEKLLFTDRAGQSDKVLSVWLNQEPLPAVTPFWNQLGDIGPRGLIVQGMLLGWAFSVVSIYALGWERRPGPTWRKGLSFGVAVWAVVFVFFEAWVPFNVLGEPIVLVLLELALQLVAMVVTGLAIAASYSAGARSRA